VSFFSHDGRGVGHPDDHGTGYPIFKQLFPRWNFIKKIRHFTSTLDLTSLPCTIILSFQTLRRIGPCVVAVTLAVAAVIDGWQLRVPIHG